MKTRDLRLFGAFTTLSPLSHIGESISTTTYLVQEPIMQPDGCMEEVFCYSGNAWRGQLRDLAAQYMLDALGGDGGAAMRLPLDGFHMLFSGGKIGGDQVVDINRAREVRKAIPMFSLFGGGMGNQILPGKMRVSNAYPVCAETAHILPEDVALHAQSSYRGMTLEKSFSRMDDAKKPELADRYLPRPEVDLLGDDSETPKAGKKAKSDGPADQMRMTTELLAAGVMLYTEIDLLGVSDVELGALVSALHRFGRSPHIGGQANKGHGKVKLDYRLLDLDSGEDWSLIRVDGHAPRLSQVAEDAKEAYDQHLADTYRAYLESNKGAIGGLLEAV